VKSFVLEFLKLKFLFQRAEFNCPEYRYANFFEKCSVISLEQPQKKYCFRKAGIMQIDDFQVINVMPGAFE